MTDQRREGIGSSKDSLLTVEEVALKLKMAPYTIRKWVRLGQLPALRLGERQIRFMPETIDRWMKEQRI